MHDYQQNFLDLALARRALRFGQFTLKSGRVSPYFFNAGLFNDGTALTRLSEFYVDALETSGIGFDMLFGSAYKGIPLVAAVAMRYAQLGRTVPYSFNRKEAKDHGEGGEVIGAPLRGRVMIVDDVISAGTSVRESVALIRAHGADPIGLVIALDRMERGTGTLSAVQEARRDAGIEVASIVSLDDVVAWLREQPAHAADLERVLEYRETYGIAASG